MVPVKADYTVLQAKTITRQWKMITVNKSKAEIYHLLLSDTIFNINATSNPEAQLGIFQGRGGVWEHRHFDKHFFFNTYKNVPAEKLFGAFSSRYL